MYLLSRSCSRCSQLVCGASQKVPRRRPGEGKRGCRRRARAKGDSRPHAPTSGATARPGGSCLGSGGLLHEGISLCFEEACSGLFCRGLLMPVCTRPDKHSCFEEACSGLCCVLKRPAQDCFAEVCSGQFAQGLINILHFEETCSGKLWGGLLRSVLENRTCLQICL